MTKKKLWIIGVMVLAFIGVLLIGLSVGRNPMSDEASAYWQEQYDLGVRYLSEGNYEEAIIAFAAAIEIDPKQVDSYIKCADAYIGLEDYEKALHILENGYDETQSTELLIKIEDIEGILNESEKVYLPNLNDDDLSVIKTLYQFMEAEDYFSIRQMVVCLENGTLNLDTFFSEKISGLYLFDGESFQSELDGYGLVVTEGGLVFGTFQKGMPNGKCTVLDRFSNTQTGYTRVSGNFANGKLNGYGEVCTIYHDDAINDYNAQWYVCDNWIDDVAVGEVELHLYTFNRVADIYRFSTNSDGTYNFQDERFVQEKEDLYYLYVEREDGSSSGYQIWVGEGYQNGVYNTYTDCLDKLKNNGYPAWKDPEGNWK